MASHTRLAHALDGADPALPTLGRSCLGVPSKIIRAHAPAATGQHCHIADADSELTLGLSENNSV